MGLFRFCCTNVFIFTAALLLSCPITANALSPDTRTNKTLKIGVRAINGVENAEKMWSPTIDELNKRIKEYDFKLAPVVSFHDMRTMAKNNKLDFILTNPLAYIELNQLTGLTRILTLNKKQPDGSSSTTFASVIFTRANRNDINTLDDFYNKSIMGVDKEAFGGWLMALRELLKRNFDPHRDSSKLLFSADSAHQTVINSVLKGNADIGVVRTGIIEQLVEQKKIQRDSIKILLAHTDSLNTIHSTPAYPEWPFSVMPHISTELSNKVFHTLLHIKPHSNAAIAGKYANWTVPLDYTEVYNLAKEIDQHHITFEKIWNKHWLTLLLLLIFITAMAVYTLYLFSINKALSQSKYELSQHRDHLEELLESRTEELVIEKEKANNENKAKSEFLSNMSHELRTPLNAILGFSQLITMEESINEKTTSNVNEIMAAGNYLLSIINEILDLAKIEAGETELNLENVSCDEIVNHSLDIVLPLAQKKNITINIDNTDACEVFADKRKLQQICINLLSNAIKYNKHDGSITVRIFKDENSHPKVSVKDSGIGIKPEFYEKVFQPFARDKENSEQVEGSGVGLVITKKLVEQMNGQIGFNSEYGKGSEFWVYLPATA